LYLDYNSTSPLADSVKTELASGIFFGANPNSLHTSGKKELKIINETTAYLINIFNINHEVIYHSGATEWLNTFVQGHLKKSLYKKETFLFAYLVTDHACVHAQVEWLEFLGAQTIAFDINADGSIPLDKMIKEINESKATNKLINITWVNSETGAVCPLTQISELKNKTNALIHVDAVQSVGKIECWQELSNEIDCYTYSSHKFGALKNSGFSLVKRQSQPEPLIYGGKQQGNIRSGTQDSMNALAIRLALIELLKKENKKLLIILRDKIEDLVFEKLGDRCLLVSRSLMNRNLNTIHFIVKDKKADIMLVKFDMESVDISSGSACSSGSLEKSKVLINMGLEQYADKALRISLAVYDNNNDNILKKLNQCLNTL
jgi:cysteine desulfurase